MMKNYGRHGKSSSKSDLPPDFYNDDLEFMMEVMRFDDQAINNGKTHATKVKENQMLKQLRELGLKEDFPNLKQILLLGNSDLSTNDDHNFARYRENFTRVVLKHAKKAEQYRKNHPGYKLIFFVFDETSGVYFERGKQKKSILTKGTNIIAKPHMYWADSALIDIIKNSLTDYFIWFKPYNSFETLNGINDDFPKIMIYDVKNMKISTDNYSVENMISSEY